MIGAGSALHATIDASLGGVLLANMLEGWLDGNPMVWPTAETSCGSHFRSVFATTMNAASSWTRTKKYGERWHWCFVFFAKQELLSP